MAAAAAGARRVGGRAPGVCNRPNRRARGACKERSRNILQAIATKSTFSIALLCHGPFMSTSNFADVAFDKYLFSTSCVWSDRRKIEMPSHLQKLQFGRVAPKLPYKNPNHLAQQQEPWSRLNSTPTITSMRREVYFFDPEIPKDDLDFRLAALYNHHTGTFKNKNETLLHQETTQDTHGIIKTQFPGEPLPPPLPPSITSQANIRHWINPKKESIHSIQGSIVSPHTAATNGGYSRKNDGGFFST
ncbi:cilia- and flagella-associated protein 276 isoform X1 [Herpailurus yagouaroundi]|uniref:cilia- and flagella-associated protein 276 isoform X1 n=1 Tax=Herpailurus yagouaroundi TaxID=1608482 RepID=UPI001AD60FF4|nr:protein C1orf194 homolog isoform X1 [Puma yagouaroundi]